MTYWFPRFDGVDLLYLRLGGPGLGNLLLTWARCHVKAARAGGQVIAPTWRQLKLGPILRKEADWRFYGDLFGDSPFELGGAERIRLLMRTRRVPELSSSDRVPAESIVEVRGIDPLFSDLIGSHDLVKQRLLATIRPSILKRVPRSTRHHIAVHVRLGDFLAAPLEQKRALAANTRTPLVWYRDVILRLRAALGADLPVTLFSDGTALELRPLTELGGVRIHPSKDALSDLLAMAQHAGLVASSSTYSMWASFLGQLPTLWPPGQMRQKFMPRQEFEFEHGGTGDIEAKFLEAVSSKLSR